METGSNEFAHFTYEYKAYRENFLEQKLHEPRSYDRRKLKNPTERLRMPYFGFTDEEVSAITTFVVGLVEDEVKHARMIPTAAKASMDFGKRVVRQKNCAACHVIDPATIEFTDEDGHRQAVKGNLLALEEEITPPETRDFEAYLEKHIAWMRENEDDEYEVEELGVLVREQSPGVASVNELLFIEDVSSVNVLPAWGGDFVDVVAEYYLAPDKTGDPDGQGRIQDVDGEWRSFKNEPYDKIRWTYAPPSLVNEGAKLQPGWFHDFLLDPVTLRPQIRVRMPTFNWADGEAAAVADFFANKAKQDWPRRYARSLLVALDKTPDEVASEISAMGLSGSSGSQVQGIADGKAIATAAGLPNLMAFGDSVDFDMSAAVDPNYEAIDERAPSAIEELMASVPDFYERVHQLIVSAEGPKCTQCHFLAGEAPSKDEPKEWAPDLLHTRERLRPDWVTEWLANPALIYPGTAMPQNFPPDQTQYQELYPGNSAEQIEAIKRWLFNMDRALLRN